MPPVRVKSKDNVTEEATPPFLVLMASLFRRRGEGEAVVEAGGKVGNSERSGELSTLSPAYPGVVGVGLGCGEVIGNHSLIGVRLKENLCQRASSASGSK